MWWGVSPALDLIDECEQTNKGNDPDGPKEEDAEAADKTSETPEATIEATAETKPEEKPEVKPEAKPEANSEAKPEAKPDAKPDAKPEVTETKVSTPRAVPSDASIDESANVTTYNVLLIGQYDSRHVLKTLAQKYRHSPDISLKMYICEPQLENVARELLFITLALEPIEHIGLAEKTRLFMELYGNSLIRPATANYLTKVAQRLSHMITNFNYAQAILPSVSLDSLKYKERDQLGTIFKYWASKDKTFDILNSWDQKIRKSLGQRYDLRVGVFDWDYHMRYRPYGADVLSAYEYKKFRERGMAFYYEDTDPSIPNKTLASAIYSGSKILNYSYLGDIETGPYVSFGFECEDEDMLKKVNGYSRKTSTDITERNIMRIFHEIQNRSEFVPEVVEEENEDATSTAAAVTEDTSDKTKISRQDSKRTLGSSEAKMRDLTDTYDSISLDKCEIIFLPTTALKDYTNKPHFENFFDLVTIPQEMVFKHLTEEILKIFKPDCKIVVDTPKYLLYYKKEDLEKFKGELEDLMAERKCKPLSSYDFKKDEFVRYKLVK